MGIDPYLEARRPPGRLKGWVWGVEPPPLREKEKSKYFFKGPRTEAETKSIAMLLGPLN